MEGVPGGGAGTEGSAAYQAALGDVLETLGRAPFDLDAVLHTILTHTTRLAHATRGFVYLLGEDGRYRHAADIGAPREVVEFNIAHPITPTRATLTGRVALERATVHIPDVDRDPEYDYPEAKRLGGFRALLGVPMLREGVVVGVLSAWRTEPMPFTDAEIELCRLFADQAVIALTTTRLVGTIERQRAELSRFLSPQVADLISSPEGERLLAGHRREITVVFCDLRGFTAFSESAEPEEVLDVLRAYHGALGRRIQEAAGTLERFTGDGVMVFFNDPLEQPEHAVRAVRMALALRSDVAELVAGWRRLGHRLGFGVGIGTGYATLGRIGYEGRYDYAAIGSVVNLTARLCAEAGDGQILLNARARARVDGVFPVRDRGEVTVKGFAQPVQVFEVADADD
ncbi:MAG TPA: adenylate/guanylate cyclase domain-containing protein [Candidatus Sulfotelmatobacter sp.]|nr:adenylate/guanylate cyclase domain-containing protein [Candidatus Sulfotelmatobacter sp.]